MKKNFFGLVCAIMVVFSLKAEEGTSTIDEQKSRVEISSNKFNGTYTNVSGSVFYNSTFSVDSVYLIVSATDVEVESGLQKDHLLSDKWMDTEKYGTVTFQSTSIEPKDEGEYSVIGNMTILGKTHEIVVMISEREVQGKKIYEGEFPVRRKDYGVGPSGDTLEEVKVMLHIETVR